MRIINVITLLKGVIETLESFPIIEDQLSDDVIEAASTCFIEKLPEHVENVSDIESYLEDGYYDDENGYEVYLTWSNSNI